jgi:hypothetical protein
MSNKTGRIQFGERSAITLCRDTERAAAAMKKIAPEPEILVEPNA